MSNYIEEENLGFDLQPAAFCSANKTCFAISGRHVLSYDVETGKRLQLLAHSEPVISAHFVDKRFITITNSGTVVSWDWKNGKELYRTDTSKDFCFRWSYEVASVEGETPDIVVYAHSVSKCGDEPMEVDESSSDNSSCHSTKASLLQLNFIDADDGQFRVTLTQVVEVPDVVSSRRHLAVGANFIAVVHGCELKITPLAHFRGKINGPLSFTHNFKFNFTDVRHIAFNEVRVLDDALFAAVNVGRLYFWSQIRECGLYHNNKTYIDVGSGNFVMAVTGQSVFTGDGASAIARWNLLSAGIGRLRHGEYLHMTAPIERLHLSANAALLLAVLADNSLHVIRTATLTVQCQVEGVNWSDAASPLDWARLTVDPSFPPHIVTNGRLGHIQWINPIMWKTSGEFDVSEENTPLRDHFTAPNYLWSNVYLVHLTAKRMVTCERRRNGFDKTYMKIYRRMHKQTMTDFRLEECVVCPQRVSFVCSSEYEVSGVAATSSSNLVSQESEEDGHDEIVRVLEGGQIDVFVPDAYRVGRWRIDPNRQRISWRKSAVRACSRVHLSAFATINEAPAGASSAENISMDDSRRSSQLDSSTASASLHSSTDDEEQGDDAATGQSRTRILLWQLPVALRIFQMIDCIADARQVEWAPTNSDGTNYLLIAGSKDIFGYNPGNASLTWRVERPGLSLFVSQLTCFAYDSTCVVFFDSASGRLKKVLKFMQPQEQIVGSGFNQKNVLIVGLSRNGINVLKSNKPHNQIQSVQLPTKKTPFSQLVAKSTAMENGFAPGDGDYVQLETKVPPASKIFDGPAHTLAPIAQLAPLYIRSCLAVRRKD